MEVLAVDEIAVADAVGKLVAESIERGMRPVARRFHFNGPDLVAP